MDSAIKHYKIAASIAEKLRNQISVPEIRIGFFSQNNIAYRNLVKCFNQKYFILEEESMVDSSLFYYLKSKDKSLQDTFVGTYKDHELYNSYHTSQNTLSKLQRLLRKKMESDYYNNDELVAQIENMKIELLDKRMLMSQSTI